MSSERVLRDSSGAKWLDPEGDTAVLRSIMDEHGEKILRIADEVHKFKNPESKRAQGFWHVMSEPKGRLVGMTGTPKPNKSADFYHIVDQLAPGTLGQDLDEFGDRYCYVGKGYRGGAEVLGFRPEKLKDLYQDGAAVMFARTTADPDSKIHLPPRIDLAPRVETDDIQKKIEKRLIHWMEVQQQGWAELRRPGGGEFSPAMERLYAAQSDDNPDVADRTAARAVPANHQVALLRWQQLAIDPRLLDEGFAEGFPDYESPKLASIADAATTHLSQNPEKGAVLFCEYTAGIGVAKEALIKRGIKDEHIGIYTGSTSPKKRRQLQKDLNEGKIKVLIGNTAALETGANLQKRANFVAHINTPWAPDRLAQSTARVYRQGQQNKVTVYRPIGSHVEELVEGVVNRKLLEASQAVGRTMQSDASIAASVRKYGKAELNRDTVAAVLGVSPDVFKPAGVAAEAVDVEAIIKEHRQAQSLATVMRSERMRGAV